MGGRRHQTAAVSAALTSLRIGVFAGDSSGRGGGRIVRALGDYASWIDYSVELRVFWVFFF
jgi:hypothetical protein